VLVGRHGAPILFRMTDGTAPAEDQRAASKPHLARLRIVEALREIGILLTAFVPLDALMGSTHLSETWPTAVGLVLVGILFFMLAVVGEGRLADER